MDVMGLQAFVAIAESGGFRRAAEKLGLSQTAVSRRLQGLEATLGEALLTRTTRSIALTKAGATLLPDAERLLREMEMCLDRVRSRRQPRREDVSIAVLPTLAGSLLPPLLAEFCADRPHVSIRLLDGSATEIDTALREGQADLAVTLIRPSLGGDLSAEPLLSEPMLLVCPQDHPLARAPAVPWRALQGERLIAIHRQSGNRALVDAAAAGLNFTPDWRHEVHHMATAITWVAAGLGLAVLPRMAVAATAGARVVARPLVAPEVIRQIGLIRRRGVVLPGAAERLAGFLRDRLRSGESAAFPEAHPAGD